VRHELPPARGPWLEYQLDALRYLRHAIRHPEIRGTRMRLGRNAYVIIGRRARLNVGRGFAARRDLTLIVYGALTVGASLFCNRGVVLAALDTITIGDEVRLGQHVSIIDHDHVLEPVADLTSRMGGYTTAPITIGNRVLIGANSVVLPGAQIGDDAVIAAGSVVRGAVPPRVLAAGAPAVVKRELA
jgi:acetyltransferase-like isoleucine patch superfamily enzyme